MASKIFHISAFIFGFRAAAFNLYPTVNPDSLAKSFGISVDCLDALNETVSCDQTLFEMSNTVDSYLWTTDNVTDLCTQACIVSTAKWWSDAQGRCAADSLAAYGKMIPAETIAGRFFDGLSIACLQSRSDFNSSAPTGLPSFPNATSASNGSAPYSNSTSASNTTSSASSWCLIESQEWVGSDVIRPNCSNNSTDQYCRDPLDVSPENERIANLYPHEMLCSDCFIKMFHQRMSSPYLPDSDYSDYLVTEYQDILDICETTMPELIIRDLPFYGDAPVAFGVTPLSTTNMPSFLPNGTQYTNGTNSTSTCTGQIIQMADLNGTASSNLDISFCDVLSQSYSVTTGDLEVLFDNQYCEPISSSYCAPAACELMRVPSSATCDSICSSANITTLQFRNWNPNINGLCNNLQQGDYICIGAPGGSYIPPPMSNISSNASVQQPGGSGTGASSNSTAPYSNSTAPTNTTTPSSSGSSGNGGAVPSPVQKGISTSCTKYSKAKHGDFCSSFAQTNGISSAQLYSLNGALGNAGENCNTTFWSGYYYCVASSTGSMSGSWNSPTAAAVTPIPSTNSDPMMPDPISTVLSTVTSTFVSTIDATTQVTSTSTPDAVPTPLIANHAAPLPSPIQTGISSLCAKYAQAHTGDTCASFAAANGIGPTDLYERNTALGAHGENCMTQFWGGYYYCVGGTD